MEKIGFTYSDISKMIDHSLVNPTLSQDALERGCQLALAYDTASISIVPYYVRRCAEILKGSTVKAGTTVGFPHGSHTTAIKLAEARQALADGAEELDMVVNISKVLTADWNYVREDIRVVVDEAHQANAKAKVIFENCYLEQEHKTRLCEICTEVGADWVKTSTGYAHGGATIEDLVLMVHNVKAPTEVKAAGGIRDLDTLLKVRSLGVTRCGATRTAAMLDEARRRLELPEIQLPSADAEVLGGY